jgi:predicted small lipoprotein YifL
MTGRIRALALTLVALSALAGCGKKGPLYLPDDGSDSQASRSQTLVGAAP